MTSILRTFPHLFCYMAKCFENLDDILRERETNNVKEVFWRLEEKSKETLGNLSRSLSRVRLNNIQGNVLGFFGARWCSEDNI